MDQQSAGGGSSQGSEARFRAIIDGFSDPILILDAYETIRYVNVACLAAFDYALADTFGRAFEELVPPEERPAVAAALAGGQPGAGTLRRFEHRLVRPDGATEIVETSPNRLSDPSGEQITILHLRVITERKRAEERLRANEERYRELVENSHDLVQSVAADGRILFANRAWLETLEYAEADLPGLSLWEIIHPDSLEECRRHFAALLLGQEPGVLRPTLRTRRGAAVEVEGTAVLQVDGGQLVATNAFFRDVTEERRSARVQAARFASTHILAESPALELALTRVLEAIASNLGWQAAELWLPDELGQRLRHHGGWQIGGDPVLDRFAAASRSFSFARGEGLPGQAWATGAVIWNQELAASPAFRRAGLAGAAGLHTGVAVPILRGHETVGAMLFFSRSPRPAEPSLEVVLADLGGQLGQFVARKEAEAALEAERAQLARRVDERTADLSRVNADLARAVRAKDEFLANMSHELRTPLNTILALSEVLLEQYRGPLNEKQQASLRSIEASGLHLLALINDILDLSKVEAGRLDLVLEPVSVAEICQISLMFVKEMALKKQLQLAFQLNDQLAMVDADAKRLKQMLVNLLSNAVKFTPAGGKVSLEVDVRPDPGSISFAVCDTGIGIAREDQARLFQPFTQVESSLQRHHEGTGLGLALVRRLAELHGGSVGVDSEPGEGSRFTITLPYSSSGGGEAGRAAESAPAVIDGGADASSPALIIDDSESAAEQLGRYLEAMNMRVVVHRRGDDALEQVARLQPRVVFLDLLLPGQSGWEVLLQLKADPRTRSIPVIIVSVVDERAKGLAAGAAAYLVKPMVREELRSALRAAAVAGQAGREPEEAPPPAAAARRARILLADDNVSNIEVIGDYLQERGYTMVIARDGREALERAAEARPDLILLDVQMPEMDGLEVARRLRADPRFAATPIIAVTALAMAGDRERCLAAGASEYMTKPLSLKRLLETIQQQLKE